MVRNRRPDRFHLFDQHRAGLAVIPVGMGEGALPAFQSCAQIGEGLGLISIAGRNAPASPVEKEAVDADHDLADGLILYPHQIFLSLGIEIFLTSLI